jgi:hypothetical protein
MEIVVKPTTTDVRNAKWAWYFGSTFGRLASAALVVLVAITAVQVTCGDIEVAKPNLGIILFLVLLPLFVGLAGLKSPAITRFTEAPIGYGFTSEGVSVNKLTAETPDSPFCAKALLLAGRRNSGRCPQHHPGRR